LLFLLTYTYETRRMCSGLAVSEGVVVDISGEITLLRLLRVRFALTITHRWAKLF
jgi:hypothetical protein